MRPALLLASLVLSSAGLALDHAKTSATTGSPEGQNIVKTILEQAADCLGRSAPPAGLKVLNQGAKLLEGFTPNVNPEDTLAALLPSLPETDRPILLKQLRDAKSCWEKPPFRAAPGSVQILGQLLASDRYRQWTKTSPPPPPKDERTEKEGSWILTFEDPLPGGDNDEYELTPGHGLVRPARGPDGAEILPSHHLAFRFDAGKNAFVLYTIDEKGEPVLARVPRRREFPGVLINGGRLAKFQIVLNTRPPSGSEVNLPTLNLPIRLRDNFIVEDVREVFGTSLLDKEFDNVIIAARARIKQSRDSDHPIRATFEPFAVPFIEDELQIGSASAVAQPLAYSWADGAKQEFILVDENARTAYRQKPQDKGKGELQRFEIVDPGRVGKAASGSKPHFVTAIKDVPASGTKGAFDDEKIAKRGWVVRDERGYLWKLEEDPGSVRGELSDKKRPARLSPLFTSPSGEKP